MNQLDVYYRALLEYRKVTERSKECEKKRKNFAELDKNNDSIVVYRNVCAVDEEWVKAIEEGLVHIEKAIKEERQFIYSNGEVVPIEKAKNVSRESVVHLAKHSNYITRVTEGEDLVPDRLYTVERLNDYAVYENRFLYMLLCYLRDFVTIRYNKLIEISGRYEGSLRVDKSVVVAKHKMSYKVMLDEEHLDDEYLRNNNELKPIIDRIDLILKTIVAFLATPLMEYAAKAAMLKPPITKTNVLKMDNNFKGAVALYDFIISYDKDGYTYEKKKVEISPFSGGLADDMAEAGILISFLTYRYGLELNSMLKERYEDEEARRRYEELRKKAEQLENLKRRIKSSDGDIGEYTLELEKHMRALQTEATRAEAMRSEIAQFKENEKLLNATIEEKVKDIDRLAEEAVVREQEHAQNVAAINSAHEKKVAEIFADNEARIRDIDERHREKLEEADRKFAELEEEKNCQLDESQQALSEAEQRINELLAEQERLTEEKKLLSAQLMAARVGNGLVSQEESFTDKESFDELEKEFTLFKKFYDEQWKKTKKQIRKNSFKWENLKGQGKKD